jgi:hypothetical protein
MLFTRFNFYFFYRPGSENIKPGCPVSAVCLTLSAPRSWSGPIHPGSRQTLAFVRQHFWWPTMVPDVVAFVAACTVCAQNQTPQQAHAGLQQLPVPHRPIYPWISSRVSTCLRATLQCGRSVFKSGPHSSFQTILGLGDSPVYGAARLPDPRNRGGHGLQPGLRFSSRFWKAFCTLIGSSASLSSGVHPQSNGQSEQANQDVERTFRYLASDNPTTWSQQLVWVE